MAETILRVENLKKIFKIKDDALFAKPKNLYAVNDVTFSLRKGETLGVIGESGCGKSTLGKCIVRLHKPTSGSILYGDFDLATASIAKVKPYRKDIQMIFQDPFSSLEPRMTAGAAVEEALLIHRIEPDKQARRAKALDILREVGLDVQHYNRYPHEFSGGQLQRISIGRALALNPKLIVCDEPVSALDVSIQAQVINLLKDLQDKHGLTYLFISHDLSVIRHVSDRILIMYLGQAVELCAAEEIYRNPLHPYTQALISAIPPESPFEIKERIKLSGDVPTPIGLQKGCPLFSRCGKSSARCSEERPQLRDVGAGHQVACFLYEMK